MCSNACVAGHGVPWCPHSGRKTYSRSVKVSRIAYPKFGYVCLHEALHTSCSSHMHLLFLQNCVHMLLFRHMAAVMTDDTVLAGCLCHMLIMLSNCSSCGCRQCWVYCNHFGSNHRCLRRRPDVLFCTHSELANGAFAIQSSAWFNRWCGCWGILHSSRFLHKDAMASMSEQCTVRKVENVLTGLRSTAAAMPVTLLAQPTAEMLSARTSSSKVRS